MTGWITAFLNYQHTDDRGIILKEDRLFNWIALNDQKGFCGSGFARDDIPSHLNRTSFVWEYYGQDLKMEFIGGVLSVENVDGYLTPPAGVCGGA